MVSVLAFNRHEGRRDGLVKGEEMRLLVVILVLWGQVSHRRMRWVGRSATTAVLWALVIFWFGTSSGWSGLSHTGLSWRGCFFSLCPVHVAQLISGSAKLESRERIGGEIVG